MVAGERITLTRDDLYARVWSMPMRTLGQQLGMSDVGLAKHCRKMKIPVPGRGYWAKLSAGKRVKQAPLPPLPPNDSVTPREAIFRPSPPQVEPSPVPAPVAAQAAFEALVENRVEVAETLRSMHPLVRLTAEALDGSGKTRVEYLGNWQVHHLDISVTKDSLRRALRIMDALVKALERRGWKVTLGPGDDRKSYVTVFEQRVPFGIREPIKKVLNDPAKPERSWSGKLYTPYQPKYRDEPSGRLALVIRNTWGHSVSQTWDERTGPRLEDQLNDFIIGVVTTAHEEAERAKQRVADERRRLEAEQQRIAEQRRREAEAARGQALQDQATRWRVSREILEYLTAVREVAGRLPGGVDASPGLAEWLAWAEGYARAVDPLSHRLDELIKTPSISTLRR